MPESSSTKSGFEYLDPIAKSIALAVGVLYIFGFIVVSVHLSQFGVSSLGVLQIQYLIAGAWALAPPVLAIVFRLAQARFEERAAPEIPKGFNWRRFGVATLLSSVPLVALMSIVVGYLEANKAGWKIGISGYAFFLALGFSAYICWISWKGDKTEETPFINRSHAAPFHSSLVFVIVLVYVVWFSRNIYPLIPFSLGGGRPLTVVFVPGERKLPDGITLDDSTKRSVPYKLVTTTDKYYVVLSRASGERSIEISRDYVSEMIVLNEPQLH